MGFAKRRKKLLGKDYGEKPPILVEGSNQFERHFQQFLLVCQEKLEEVGKASELEEEEAKVKQEQLHQWLENYLSNYRNAEREKLIRGILDPVYFQLVKKSRSQKAEPEWILNWSIEAVSLYKIFKSYLSKSTAMLYAKPLRKFYETVMREGLEDASKQVEAQEKIGKLKQLFEETLEIEESKRI